MSINFPCPRCGGFHGVNDCSPEAALTYLSGMLTLPGFTTKASETENEQIRRYLSRRDLPQSPF
ncbi:MAG TPA: hypothetical protein VH134_17235 [Candidatus Dormibacteraeota bacterium]|jgi:hypothetical protein|nr:hypothetical protein [Candidatus Dormibacteraeota bacterium]